MYIYIYIYREREIDREREIEIFWNMIDHDMTCVIMCLHLLLPQLEPVGLPRQRLTLVMLTYCSVILYMLML